MHYKTKFIYSFFITSAFCLALANFYFFPGTDDNDLTHYLYFITHCNTDNIKSKKIYTDLSEEYKFLNEQYFGNKVTVFAGDSITKRFNLTELTRNENIINRGIFYDTTYGLLERHATNINNLQIDKFFLMIGHNDLKIRTNDEILQNIKQILSKTEADKIYLQSLLPVSIQRKEFNNRILTINARLKELSCELGCTYIDLHSHFLDDAGGMNPILSNDGIHPNYHGYKLWLSIIDSLL